MLEAVHSRISVYALQLLSSAGVAVAYCDERHMPIGFALPFSGNVLTQSVTAAQLMMSQKEKDRIWQRVVQAKICNQELEATDNPAVIFRGIVGSHAYGTATGGVFRGTAEACGPSAHGS